jgi:hypothetical protein
VAFLLLKGSVSKYHIGSKPKRKPLKISGFSFVGSVSKYHIVNAEQIEQIVWRVDSKIARIVRTTNSEKRSLEFE